MTLHPVAGHRRVVFLKPVVSNPNIVVGEYSYYDDPDDPTAFERDAVLYAYGPERLVIGRYCAIASGVRFLLPGANHADLESPRVLRALDGGPERIAADLRNATPAAVPPGAADYWFAPAERRSCSSRPAASAALLLSRWHRPGPSSQEASSRLGRPRYSFARDGIVPRVPA